MKTILLFKLTWLVIAGLLAVHSNAQPPAYMFHAAIKDKAGNLWFASSGHGVYRYDATSGAMTDLTVEDGMLSDAVLSLLEDKAGNIWVGTSGGVSRYDGKGFTHFTMENGLSGISVNSVLEDNTGKIWFGTSRGACFYNPATAEMIDTLFNKDLHNIEITSIRQERSGNVWFFTNGFGIFRYSGVSVAFKNFTTEDGLGSNTVQCILEDKSGRLWFGERAGGVSLYDPVTDKFVQVNAGGCLSSQVMGIIQDKTGSIWFANLYDGLCRYDGKSFTHFTKENGLYHNNVTCIYKDGKGDIWCGSDAGNWGSDEGGLCRYDGKSFTRFTSQVGISEMNVWTIIEDNEGNIWVGTKGGLYKYHSPSGRFIDYTHKLN